jgi:hypothetical protein
MQPEIILGDHKFATARLRRGRDGTSYRVSANRKKMILYFVNPRETVKIEGADNVIAALQELEFVFNTDDEIGWQ